MAHAVDVTGTRGIHLCYQYHGSKENRLRFCLVPSRVICPESITSCDMSCTIPPCPLPYRLGRLNCNPYFTVTFNFAVFPLPVFTVMTAFPFAFARSFPVLLFTMTTFLFDD